MRPFYKAVMTATIGIFIYAAVFHFVFSLAGCKDTSQPSTVQVMLPGDTTHYVKYSSSRRDGSYSILMIEGCEYIIFMTANGDPSITHKGNCKNPIHKR